MNRVRTGELPWTDLDGLHRMTLDDLLVQFNITGLTEAEKVHLNKVWHRLHPWPDAPSGLARLATRYVLSPMSNGNVALLTEMAKFGGLPWDCVMGSDIVRHYKPDGEMYLAPSEFFDIQPEQTMLVAAHPGDLDSAKSFGLRTAYVHRPLERGPDAEPWDPPEAGRFDFIAMDFHDLAAQRGPTLSQEVSVAINTGKVIVGGLAAGAVLNIIDVALNMFVFADRMTAEMNALNPALIEGMEGAGTIAGFVVLDFVLGILAVLTYAAIRPRFGPGQATAIKAGVLVWAISGATWAFLVFFGMISIGFFLMSGVGALVNFLVSTSVGARVYSEA
jgi:2-haloacid dehalogenase